MAWSRAFQKCIIFHFFGQSFLQTFYNITGFCDKKFNFCKFAIFFADSKSRVQKLSNDVSFVIFGHQTWDLDSISWFSSTPAEIGLNWFNAYQTKSGSKFELVSNMNYQRMVHYTCFGRFEVRIKA